MRFTTAEIVRSFVLLLLTLAAFGTLSALTGWPGDDGWGAALVVALVFAALPLLGRFLTFLKESRGLFVVGKSEVKFDFRAAPQVRTAEPEQTNLDPEFGQIVNDSNAASVSEAVRDALGQPAVVVDLGTGRSWYPTRLFALAATLERQGAAEVIVLIAQRGGQPKSFVGWLNAADVVAALRQSDPRYGEHLRSAEQALAFLQSLPQPGFVPGPPYAGLSPAASNVVLDIKLAFPKHRELALAPAIVSACQKAGPGTQPSPPLEDLNAPVWLSAADAERLFEPWLVRTSLSNDASERQIRETIAVPDQKFTAVTDHGRFEGIVDLDKLSRQIVTTGEAPKNRRADEVV